MVYYLFVRSEPITACYSCKMLQVCVVAVVISTIWRNHPFGGALDIVGSMSSLERVITSGSRNVGVPWNPLSRQAKRQVTPRCCVERPFWWDAAAALKWSGTFDWHPRLDAPLVCPVKIDPCQFLDVVNKGSIYSKYLAYFWLIMVVKIIPVTSAAIYLIILRILAINVNRRLLQDVFFRISSIKLYEKKWVAHVSWRFVHPWLNISSFSGHRFHALVTTPGVIGIRLGPMLGSEGHGQIHWAWILPRSEDQVLNGNHRF